MTEDGWVFDEMDPFIVELIRDVPGIAVADDEPAHNRIFSAPTGGSDAEADADWREYIEPGLRELFKSHTDIVAADIATARQKEDASTLTIPAAHARAWIHTLNQARLALGARHGVTEEDTAGRRQHSGEKAFALMQIDFYAMLLSLLLSRTEL